MCMFNHSHHHRTASKRNQHGISRRLHSIHTHNSPTAATSLSSTPTPPSHHHPQSRLRFHSQQRRNTQQRNPITQGHPYPTLTPPRNKPLYPTMVTRSPLHGAHTHVPSPPSPDTAHSKLTHASQHPERAHIHALAYSPGINPMDNGLDKPKLVSFTESGAGR